MADESRKSEDSLKGTILTGKELNENSHHGTVTSTSGTGENQPVTTNNPEDSLRLEHSNSQSYTSKSGDPLMVSTKDSAEDKSKSKSENSDSCSRNFADDHSDSEHNKKDPEKSKSKPTSKDAAKKTMATDKTSHKQQAAKAVPFTRTQAPTTKAPSPGRSNRAHSSRKKASPKSWKHSNKSSKKVESFVAPRISPSWHAHPKYSPKELTYTQNERSSPERSLIQGTGQSIGGPVVCPMIRVSRFSKLASQGQRSVYPQPMLLYWNPARQGNISKMDEKRMNAKMVCRVSNCLMHASILTVNLQSHSLYILIDHEAATDTLNVPKA